MRNEPIRYGSVCSGIEAATVAWHPLGWQPQWFSQYDPEWDYENRGPDFASRVLKHHWPHVPNLGDMCRITENKTFDATTIDLLVGGTPCQSFSVAGLRKGLDDERGNLALEFVRLLMRKRPRWFVWENVPGVLSSGGHAENYQSEAEFSKDFACILSAFTGRDVATSQTLAKAGIIEGTFYSVAWRILDSQYFGVPQRRRRVFVIGYLGTDWRPPAAVLFERDSLRRDFTPQRKEGQGTAGNIESRIDCTGEGITGTVSKKWAKGTGGPAGDEHYNLIVDAQTIDVRNNEVNDEQSGTLQSKPNGGYSLNFTNPVAYCLNDQDGESINVEKGEQSPTLRAQSHQHEPVVCYIPLAFKVRQGKEGGGKGYLGKVEQAFACSTSQDQYVYNPVRYGDHNQDTLHHEHGVMNTLPKGSKGNTEDYTKTVQGMVVRRLTPLECERLQGFPDGHTDIPGDLTSDSRRYSAIGNSMTTYVMAWIGSQIDKVDKLLHELKQRTA